MGDFVISPLPRLLTKELCAAGPLCSTDVARLVKILERPTGQQFEPSELQMPVGPQGLDQGISLLGPGRPDHLQHRFGGRRLQRQRLGFLFQQPLGSLDTALGMR